MEAVDKRDSCVFCDLWLDVFSDGSGTEHTKVLPFSFAVLVGLDGCDEEIVSN